MASSLRKTLLAAAVCALLAMLFVPYRSHGTYSRQAFNDVERSYKPFFEVRRDADLDTPQLLLNVAFACLAGAVVVNLSKRNLYWAAGFVVLVAVGSGVATLVIMRSNEIHEAVGRAQSQENFAAQLKTTGNLFEAKKILLLAADNWRKAGEFAKEQTAREKERKLPNHVFAGGVQTTPAAGINNSNDWDEIITPTPTPH